MNLPRALGAIALLALSAAGGCGSSGSSSSTIPAQAAPTHVRLADGAPFLETLENGLPIDITPAYVQIGSNTISNDVSYGTITPFTTAASGVLSITARNSSGFVVGPLKTPSLTAGGHYTLVVVGTYPNYKVLAFQEPAPSTSAQLSLYEASPSVPKESFGTFKASTGSVFKQVGSAAFGSVTTVTLGKSVTDVGGYVGSASSPTGKYEPVQLDSFDTNNALPFNAAARLSLFLFDVKAPSITPVYASLDR